MLDDPLDRPVLSACVTALEDHQHHVAVLDDMLLNLDELDLKIAQRLLVSFAATLLCDASPWLLPLLTSIASELQKEDEQVEKVEVKGESAHDGLLPGNDVIVILQVNVLDALRVIGGQPNEYDNPDH